MGKKGIWYSGRAVFLQCALLLGILFLLIAGSNLLLVDEVRQHQDSSVQLNVAGLQRMLMARFAYDSLFAEISKDAHAQAEKVAYARSAADTATIIDANFDGLLETGTVYPHVSGRRSMTIQTISDPAIRSDLSAARTKWEDLRKKIAAKTTDNAGPRDSDQDLEQNIRNTLFDAVKAQDDAVITMEKYFTDAKDRLIRMHNNILYAGIVIFALSLTYMWFFVAVRIERSREEVERANAAKSTFLAHMSHELRTPMNSVLGMTRLLYEDETLDGEYREMAGVAYRSADGLLDILNDILDISKIEAQQLKLEAIPFALQEITNNVMETMMPISSAKGLGLSCAYQGDDIPYLVGDPLRMRQVIMNIVGNAVKYTQAGQVSVTISGRKLGVSRTEVRIAVADTGIGIPKDKQKTVFGAFGQADASITRRFGGTGLGLNITKQLVEMMGGTISVESEPGKGSVFTVTVLFGTSPTRPVVAKRLAAKREAGDFLPEKERKPIEAARILIAEDHAMNLIYMRKLFKRENIQNFDVAENGAQGLEAYRRGGYDAIITDCHMPEMSGYDFSRKVRESEKDTGRRIPIIAMTADAMVGSREKCFDAGMDDFVTKPVDPDELKDVLSRWFILPKKQEPSKPDGSGRRGAAAAEALDLSRLKQFAGTPEEMQGFFDIFVRQADEILEVLRDNCGGGRNETWSEAAHKLKGSASMIGAARLQRLCAQAQEMLVSSAAERKALYDEILSAYEDVKIQLDNLPAGKKGASS